jgi:hypothetical protein
MATKRTRRTRNRVPEISPLLLTYLETGERPAARDADGERVPGWFDVYLAAAPHARPTLQATWHLVRESVLARWAVEQPGARPWAWWALEPHPLRQQIGGTGHPAPEYIHAEPDRGVSQYWSGLDPADPPVFESEAAYLDRHGLMPDAERRRVPASAFEPEAVE